MHDRDTPSIALHLDGLQCDYFILGQSPKIPFPFPRIFYHSSAQKKLEIHKVFLRFFCLICGKISRGES